MGDPAIDPGERWSYRHYRTWPDEERWELIEGVAYSMSPAPRTDHQRLLLRLARLFSDHLEGRPCEVFIAPFDVLLPRGEEEDEEVESVVQPDLTVFCDPGKIRGYGARGAPDLVVEILSPSSSRKDQREKFDLYQRVGVREYWVIDPLGAWLCRYELGAAGRFDPGELREPDRDYSPIESKLLSGLSLDPASLFARVAEPGGAAVPASKQA